MKLGEALTLRARQAQQLDDLRGRIRNNAIVQDGQTPAENPEKLIEEFVALSDEHSQLLERIARTNAANEAANGDNMLSLLHQREALSRKRNIHTAAAVAGTPSRDSYRYRTTELAYVPAVNVQEHRKTAEELDEAVNRLNAILQESNWQIELV